MKWLKRSGWVLLAVIVIAGIALGWLLGTHSGLEFALSRATAYTDGALSVQQAQGRLAGPMTLHGVRYHDPKTGLDAKLGRLHVNLRLAPLLASRLHLLDVQAEKIDVQLPSTEPASAKKSPALSLRAPIDVILDHAHVGHVRIHRGKHDVFVSDSLDLAGSWSSQRIEFTRLKLRAPDGHVDLHGKLVFGRGYPGRGHVSFDWKTADNRWVGALDAHSNGRKALANVQLKQPLKARLDLDLEPREPFDWKAHLQIPRTDAEPLIGSGSVHTLGANLHAEGNRRRAHVQGMLDLDDTRLQLADLSAHLSANDHEVLLDKLSLTSPQVAGTLDGHGRIRLDPAPLDAELHLQWQKVVVPADLAGQKLATHGLLDFSGSSAHYQASAEVHAGPPGKLSNLHVKITGTPGRIAIERLLVKQPHGKFDAHGTLQLDSGVRWKLEATASHFNPGLLLAGWPGSLDAHLDTHGLIADHGTSATLDLHQLDGTLRQRPVHGQGKLSLSGKRVLNGSLNLRSGSGRVQLTARGTESNDIDLKLDIDSLGDWVPQARGSLKGRVHIRGLWPELAVAGHLQGRKLVWSGQRADTLKLDVDIADISHPGGNLQMHATGVDAAGFAFRQVDIDGKGNRSRHHLRLDAQGKPLSLKLALSGGMHGSAWQGTLEQLDLDLVDMPPWKLRKPASLRMDHGDIKLGQTCLSPGVPELCVAAEQQRDGKLSASYRLRKLPLELVTALAVNDLPIRARGVLDGQGKIQRDAKGALHGQASLQSDAGMIFYTDHPHKPLLKYRNLDARMDLVPDGEHLKLTADLQEKGRLDGDVHVSGPQQNLSGRIAMHLDNLRFVELFTTEVANLDGNLDATLQLAGTLAKPAPRGRVVVDNLSGEIPALGLKLDQGKINANSTGADALALDGQVHSGGGTLKVSGQAALGADASTHIKLSGSKVQVANIPSASVTISPDLDIQRGAGSMQIGGSLSVDKADVHLEKLPGAGATQASPDVVVVDARKKTRQDQGLPLKVNVQVALGKHTHVVGYGLDGNLHGHLRVIQRPGKAAIGQGQIRIDGTFHAYGQDLHIQQGRLLFASTPVSDPGLDIRAVRKLNPNATVDEGQEVGLEISGTAQRPQVTVFSNPTMEQSDALSYLVTGKPLSQVKGGEGNAVNSAAQALGSATGDLLAKGIGSRLGISDIGVSNSEALGTSAFTVGKYLSPKLYLSYGVGLFEPGQVVTLRYILSRRWNFEAEQASEFSRASFNYRLER